jgi:cellobiose-specific phosphotransferase system component IIC
MKISKTPPGIEPTTFWLITQCLNKLRHGVPPEMSRQFIVLVSSISAVKWAVIIYCQLHIQSGDFVAIIHCQLHTQSGQFVATIYCQLHTQSEQFVATIYWQLHTQSGQFMAIIYCQLHVRSGQFVATIYWQLSSHHLNMQQVPSYAYQKFSSLFPPTLLWRKSGIFWIGYVVYVSPSHNTI